MKFTEPIDDIESIFTPAAQLFFGAIARAIRDGAVYIELPAVTGITPRQCIGTAERLFASLQLNEGSPKKSHIIGRLRGDNVEARMDQPGGMVELAFVVDDKQAASKRPVEVGDTVSLPCTVTRVDTALDKSNTTISVKSIRPIGNSLPLTYSVANLMLSQVDRRS